MLLLRPWLLMQGAWHTVGAVCHLALAKVPSRQDLSLQVPLGVLKTTCPERPFLLLRGSSYSESAGT